MSDQGGRVDVKEPGSAGDPIGGGAIAKKEPTLRQALCRNARLLHGQLPESGLTACSKAPYMASMNAVWISAPVNPSVVFAS